MKTIQSLAVLAFLATLVSSTAIPEAAAAKAVQRELENRQDSGCYVM